MLSQRTERILAESDHNDRKIRRLVEGPGYQDELEAIIDIWFHAGKAEYSYLPLFQQLTRQKAGEVFREVILQRCEIWTGWETDAPAAFLAMAGDYVDRLYVDPPRQHQGWGTRLIEFAKILCPEGLRLHTHQANDNARALYESRGFSAVKFGLSAPPESVPDVEYRWQPEL